MSRDKYIFLHKNLYEIGGTAIKKQYESYNKRISRSEFCHSEFFLQKNKLLENFWRVSRNFVATCFLFFLLQLDGCAGCSKFCFFFFRCFFLHSSHYVFW